MMPTDTNNTTLAALAVPGIEPELQIYKILFAALTPQERVQEVDRLTSLLAKRTS